MDPPLPLRRPGREGVRRPGRDHARDGSAIVDEIAVADAHPLGARPFARARLRRASSAAGRAACSRPSEIERFLDLAERLPDLTADEVGELTIVDSTRRRCSATAPVAEGSCF